MDESEALAAAYQSITLMYHKFMLNSSKQQGGGGGGGEGRRGVRLVQQPFIESMGGKDGSMRTCTVKRVERTARAVIGPDSSLQLNQIRLSVSMANSLNAVTMVTQYNQSWLKEQLIVMLARGGKISRPRLEIRWPDCMRPAGFSTDVADLAPGCEVTHSVFEGTPAWFYRQPVLWPNSYTCFTIVIGTDDCIIGMHPTRCIPFNADFDGDEMNVHVPGNATNQMAIHALGLATRRVMQHQSGAPVISPAHDSMVGCHLASLDSVSFPASALTFLFSDVHPTHKMRALRHLRQRTAACESPALINARDLLSSLLHAHLGNTFTYIQVGGSPRPL
jgi:DNA-directed RNA polymerase beta' subunit